MSGNKSVLYLISAIILMTIMLINPVSAGISKSFVKDATTSTYGKIQIADCGFLGTSCWFGDGTPIAEYELKFNTDLCIINCRAETEIVMHNDGVLIDKIDFEYMKGSNIVDYNFKIREKVGEKIVNDYGKKCTATGKMTLNGTSEETCSTTVTGNHTENLYEYKDYKAGDVVQAGTYYIVLNGVKQRGSSVDWIFTSQGKQLSEWAVWTDSFNVGLRAYYNFSSGFESAINYAPYNNTLTNRTGTPTIIRNATTSGIGDGSAGYFNGSVGLRATARYDPIFNMTNTTDALAYPKSEYTFNFWVNAKTGNSFWIAKYNGAGSGWSMKLGGGGASMYMTGASEINFGSVPNPAKWQMISGIVNSTDTCIYVNASYRTCVGSKAFPTATIYPFEVGFDTSDNDYWLNGYIDEISFWNRSLSNSELTDLYNNGAGLTYIPTVVDIMTVTSSYPADLFKTSASSVGFGCNATGGGVIVVNSLVLNVSTWTQTITGLSQSNYNGTFTNTTLADGTYTWNCISYGSAGVNGSSTARTFTKDTTKPTVSVSYPLNSTVELTSINWNMTFSTTDALTNISACWYSVDGGTAIQLDNICNSTKTITSQTMFNMTGNKRHTLVFSANDSLNNIGTASVSFYSFNYSHSADKSAVADGDDVTFTLILNGTDISSEFPSTNATLKFQNVIYQADSSTFTNAHKITFAKTLTIPVGTGNGSGISAYYNWTFNIKNLTALLNTNSTDTKNISVKNISIGDCTLTGGRMILNFTLKDEETMVVLNKTTPNVTIIEVDVNISSRANLSMSWQFYQKWEGNNTVALCIPTEILNSTSFRIDFTAGFSASNHVQEFYYLENGTLDNTHYFNAYTDDTIDLLDLASVDSTTFLFEYTDENSQKVDDIIVHTFRKYIGEGLFREAERSKEDDSGQTHVHLVEEDVIYYFMITQSGRILYTSGTYNAKCLATPCEISLSASPTEHNWSIIDNEGGEYLISTVKSSRISTLTFNIQASDLVNLSIYRFEDGMVTYVNGSSLSAMSGSIPVFIPFSYGNETYFASIFRNNTFVKSEWIDLTADAKLYFGTFGAILGALIILAMMLMAVSEGAGFIVFTILAVIIVGVMQLVNLSWMAIISIVCAGGIILWKIMSRRNKPN